MKVLLATPLYPPDIAEPAPYIKELARRLASAHEVTVLTYGRFPEQVPGVRIISIDKGQPLLTRLSAYTRALLHEGRIADVIYAVNGASVELPFILTSLVSKKHRVFAIADHAAHERAALPYHLLERIAAAHAHAEVRDFPLPRPEILPFSDYPQEQFTTYEHSWEVHLEKLSNACSYDR